MQVIVTNRATNDLIDLFDYNSKISINYAIRIDKKIRSYIETLEAFPYIGRYVPEIHNMYYRERIYEKFRVVYYVFEAKEIIFVQFVFNAKQDKRAFLNIHKNDVFKFLNQIF